MLGLPLRLTAGAFDKLTAHKLSSTHFGIEAMLKVRELEENASSALGTGSSKLEIFETCNPSVCRGGGCGLFAIQFLGSQASSLSPKVGLVRNSKHLETSGSLAGLWVRTARALRNAGYKSRRQVRADIQSGALHPFISIFDYGKFADAEVRAWLGLKSWDESWGKTPRIVSRRGSVKSESGLCC